MGRAPCCDKVGLKKGRWSKEEDDILANFIAIHGPRSWRSLPKRAGLLRCGKSCRLRWINYLRADVKRGNFAPHEDRIILNLHSSLGNRWSLIAAHLPGRTDNEIKNYWNSHLSRTIVSLPKAVSEETTPATSISSVTDNHADNGTNRNSSGNTACEPIAIEEDDINNDNDEDEDEDDQYCRVDKIIITSSTTTLHHPDMSVPVQPDMSGTTTTSSAGSCVSFTNNMDQSGLQGPGPLSPLDDNAVLDMIDSLLENDGWAEEAGTQYGPGPGPGYGPGLSGLDKEMDQNGDDLVGCDWAEIEAQLWDESVVDLWAGFGDGGSNWDALPDWILSDN